MAKQGTLKVGDIVTMKNIRFHGNTEGVIKELNVKDKQGFICVLVKWGDMSEKGWFQNGIIQEYDLELANVKRCNIY
jgi:hypothetical protein